MKKLIMCVASVLSACALNAATVNWSVSDLFDDNYESLVGSITLASGSFSDTATIDGGFAGGTLDGFTWGTDPFATGSTWHMTAKIQGEDGNYYQQVFDVVLGTIDPSDDRANMSAFEALTVEAQATMLPNVTLDITDLPSSGWAKASIPEPTSGLLLLVGGAMLALRRKRA